MSGARAPTDGNKSAEHQGQLNEDLSVADVNTQNDRRWALRRGIQIDADLRDSAGLRCSVTVTEISEEGCAIETDPALDLTRNSLHTIHVNGFLPLKAYVIWSSGGRVGLALSEPLHPITVQRFADKSVFDRLLHRLSR